jgi:UDP-N-acetylglucosamine 1-carboxyvinyltransferase
MTNYKTQIGQIVSELRKHKGWTQNQLAEKVKISSDTINQIEQGQLNIDIELLNNIATALGQDILQINNTGKFSFRITGPTTLHGEVTVNSSKNAAVGLLCASLLNEGKTTLRNMSRIEEVSRIIEVLTSIGLDCRWLNETDLEIIRPQKLKLNEINIEAAQKTRSILMFLGPLLNQYAEFKIPFSGGCSLGVRTVEPHLNALKDFGLNIEVTNNYYLATTKKTEIRHSIVLTERGDTTTENILMAAALYDGEVIIRNASPNYMVQDVCFYLQKLGVQIEGIGTTILKVRGLPKINKDVEYFISEDPIEAMTLVAAGIVTNSELTIKRVPIEFMEQELAVLKTMGLIYDSSEEYMSLNGQTRLIDLHIYQSQLKAPKDKIHALPFPGINMDNLPFFGLVATVAEGRTLIHDWSYENRAIYFTHLTSLGVNVELIDQHRVYISGPTKWRSTYIVAPPALRPSMVLLLAMLAAPGTSMLRDVYNINRGYKDFADRLNAIGAHIESVYG